MFQIINIYLQHKAEVHNETAGPGSHLLGRVESLNNTTSVFTLLTAVVIIVFLVALLLKEHHLMAKLTKLVPTSGILIILGIISALLTHLFEEQFQNKFPPAIITANLFQHVLIFPILLYTSYTLYNQQFLRQITSVYILSVFGTILNVLLTGLILKYIHDAVWNPYMSLTQSFAFASLISVVDPLAVVTVFQGVSQAKGNFFLAFGAALFGYGVAMELFEAANVLAVFEEEDTIPMSSYGYFAAATITDVFWGIMIGVTCGLVSAAITKTTTIECEYFEPLITLGFALFGYVLCLDLGFSYIFSTIFCGLVQERYTSMNMSPKSSMNTENIIFGFAFLTELLMFLLIGYLVVDVGFYAVWDFTIAVIIIIYVIRIFITLGLSLLLNIFRLSTISFKWQLMIFGGHRGPMSFAMVLAYTGPFGRMFRDTTLLVIVFSVMVDGVMTRYLGSQLKLKSEARESVVNDLLVTTVVYGGGELSNLLGVEMVANRTNCFHAFERMIFRFFITDEDKLTNVYRMHTKVERRLAMQKLEKHYYIKPDSKKSDTVDEEDTGAVEIPVNSS